MPGRDGGYLPGGPYTLTQGVVFLVLLVVVWKLPLLDWLGPARWGLPLAAVVIRRARIESRTPLSWLIGLVSHLLAPATGALSGRPYRPDRPVRNRHQVYLHTPDGLQEAEEPTFRTGTSSPLQLMLARARGGAQ